MSSTRFPITRANSLRALGLSAAALLVSAGAASAQVQANYPLLTDLNDTTGAYGPMTLAGNPPPAAPSNGVCVNGVYFFAGGQDAYTPAITTLDTNDFELQLEFQVAALNTFDTPVFVGGNGWRWIGFYTKSDGTFGALYNNASFTWSSAMITLGTWHSAILKYEGGALELYLDGALVHQDNIGPLNTGNDLDFTTNNYSNGTNLNGCIRNLVIVNDTTLGSIGTSIGTPFCSPAVSNSTGMPGVLEVTGSAVAAGNNVTLTASNLQNNQFGLFLNSLTQGFVPNPAGSQGNLCLGGAIGRYNPNAGYPIQNTGATGMISITLDLASTPTPTGFTSITAGQTWHFQAWYRDLNPGVTTNFTNGVAVQFQ